MRALVPVLAAGLLLMPASAAGCDLWCGSWGEDVLFADQPVPTPAARATPLARVEPVRPDTIASDLGLHRVTEVWAGDVVVRSGLVTTYSSNTVSLDAGTYAKQVATVATGQSSAYDSLLSNRRSTLTDGRPVSGDIYANYLRNGTSVVFDQYVFFQDDQEVARLTTPAPVKAATPEQSLVPVRTPGPTTPSPGPVARPTPAPRPTVRPTASPSPIATPRVRDPRRTPAPTAGPRPRPAAPRPTPTPAPGRVVRAGIALAPQGDTLGRIEVLRGRRVDLWPRATVDGWPGRVSTWQLESGEVTALGALSGTGDRPFGARWDDLAPLGSSFRLRFSVTVEVPGEPSRRVDALIDVVVRSPALVE